jgi:uncharacterized damage-inducible protein DinB
MSVDFELLAERFRHDAESNQVWLRYLTEKGIGEPDMSVFAHILSGQEAWYRRCMGFEVWEMPNVPATVEAIQDLQVRWQEVLSARSDDPLIHYHRLDRTPGHLRLSQIAFHVLDHGTYHRGELRGLCRARGDEDFPETGLSAFYLRSNS